MSSITDIGLIALVGVGAYLLVNRVTGGGLGDEVATATKEVVQYAKEETVVTLSPLESQRDYNILHPAYEAGYWWMTPANPVYTAGQSVGAAVATAGGSAMTWLTGWLK